VDGKLVKTGNGNIARQLPHLGDAGVGVIRGNVGIEIKIPHLANSGKGVNSGIAHITDRSDNRRERMMDWMRELADLLRPARISVVKVLMQQQHIPRQPILVLLS
jgi:hypothetical protein